MANEKAIEQLREDGYIPWVVERQLGPVIKQDFYFCGDVFGHSPDPNRRDRIVQSCGTDVQEHIDKLLKGWDQHKIKKNKETGVQELVVKKWPPNPYLPTLLLKYEFFIYSFIIRKAMRGGPSIRECRKWKAILSPEGQVSFALESQSA